MLEFRFCAGILGSCWYPWAGLESLGQAGTLGSCWYPWAGLVPLGWAGTSGPGWYLWALLVSLDHAAAFSGFTISVMTHISVQTHMDFNVRK